MPETVLIVITCSSETTYSALIGKFVNDAKRQVEDAYTWNSLAVETVVSRNRTSTSLIISR